MSGNEIDGPQVAMCEGDWQATVLDLLKKILSAVENTSATVSRAEDREMPCFVCGGRKTVSIGYGSEPCTACGGSGKRGGGIVGY